MLWAGTMEELKEFFWGCWTWLAPEKNYGRVIALATVAGVLISLVGLFINGIRRGEIHLSLKGFQALLEEREQQVTQRLSRAHGDERRLLENELTEVRHQLANIEPAYAEALKQSSELEPALARLSDDSSNNQRAEIRAAIETGDFSQADALLAEIADRTDGAVERAAAAAFQRGHIAAIQIKWGEAATHFDTAARLNPTYDHLNEAGTFAERAAQYKPARRHFEELLELSHREHGERSPETATVLNNLAGVLWATGQYAEAEPLYRQALEIVRTALGEEHPDYALSLNNLAFVLGETDQCAEAESLYRQALEIVRTTLGEEHPSYALSLNNLAGVLWATGQYAEAEPLYQQAVEIIRTALGDEHPNTRRLAGNYVRLLRAQFPDNPGLAKLNAVLGEGPQGRCV